MIFYYKPVESGKARIMFRCMELQDLPQFEYLEYTPTDDELALIGDNYDLFIENGILLIEKPQRIKDVEEKQILQEKITQSENRIAELESKIAQLITLIQP